MTFPMRTRAIARPVETGRAEAVRLIDQDQRYEVCNLELRHGALVTKYRRRAYAVLLLILAAHAARRLASRHHFAIVPENSDISNPKLGNVPVTFPVSVAIVLIPVSSTPSPVVRVPVQLAVMGTRPSGIVPAGSVGNWIVPPSAGPWEFSFLRSQSERARS